MAKAKEQSVSKGVVKQHIKRNGVHAKKRSSKIKGSQLYKKPSVGQGK
jgi:hypothetical protein